MGARQSRFDANDLKHTWNESILSPIQREVLFVGVPDWLLNRIQCVNSPSDSKQTSEACRQAFSCIIQVDDQWSSGYRWNNDLAGGWRALSPKTLSELEGYSFTDNATGVYDILIRQQNCTPPKLTDSQPTYKKLKFSGVDDVSPIPVEYVHVNDDDYDDSSSSLTLKVLPNIDTPTSIPLSSPPTSTTTETAAATRTTTRTTTILPTLTPIPSETITDDQHRWTDRILRPDNMINIAVGAIAFGIVAVILFRTKRVLGTSDSDTPSSNSTPQYNSYSDEPSGFSTGTYGHEPYYQPSTLPQMRSSLDL